MKFYAYKPDENGDEPLGTSHRLLFELKTKAGANRRAKRLLGNDYVLMLYQNFYFKKSFTLIHGREK